jgi:lipopolysaccharide/colanic/teichoic acid biosynthesis glycosyltransferase
MSTEIHPPLSSQQGDALRDIAAYAAPAHIPPVLWLREVPDGHRRRNLRCLSPATRAVKRALDLVLAVGMLIVLAPVMLLVAIAVKLTSRGPVIFRQTRVGLNLREVGADRRQEEGEPPEGLTERRVEGNDRRQEQAYGRHFTLYKFRTMRTDAEKNGAQFAVAGDKRVTSIGRFLRKTRLDELPQLWNVIKGEMSMVGPRPERPEFIKKLSDEIPGYLNRLGLQPGLTGVAQIENGYDNDIEGFRRKVAYDLLYLKSCNVWNDLRILFRTISVVVRGSGAL